MTIKELQDIFLSTKKITAMDFFVLLMTVTKKEKSYLFAHPEYPLTKREQKKIFSFFARRIKHEPVAYILGEKEFYRRTFFVTRDTLIPRPETELLVQLVLDSVSKSKKSGVIFDIGTGSGNIIISLTKEMAQNARRVSEFSFLAGDISSRALAVARKNAKYHKVNKSICFRKGSLLDPFYKTLSNQKGEIFITANLPYLSSRVYEQAPIDVKQFEPKTALLSEKLGLAHYYELFTSVQKLQKKVVMFLEISPEQTTPLRKKIFSFFPKAKITIHKDLAKRNRIIVITL